MCGTASWRKYHALYDQCTNMKWGIRKGEKVILGRKCDGERMDVFIRLSVYGDLNWGW